MMSAPRLALTSILALFAALAIPPAAGAAEEALLAGTVTAAARDALAGVTVSAKADGQTITTTVFTDEAGRYYFPALPPGKYRIWAQARGFEAGRAELDLAQTRQQDFALRPTADFARQLTGDQMLAALPEATPDERRLKRLVHNNCSGCHTPSYVLQHRFDEAGWTAVMDLMKHVNVGGIYQPQAPVNAIIDFHEKELATYLARARGPGESAMSFKARPRPSGEAARVVFREYDVPVDPALEGPGKYVINDGSDWSMGTPSGLEGGHGIHDAWADLDGNLWYTDNSPNRDITVGRIDRKTGAVKTLKVAGMNGLAAGAHGLTRDAQGNFWFNVGPTTMPNHGGLARLDPRSEKIDVFVPPASMSGTGGAVTLDIDGKGKVWVSAPDGALRFDPQTEAFTEFKSPQFKTPHGTGITYGVAADRDGNGWWAQMGVDIVDTSVDLAAGKAVAIEIPPVAAEKEGLTPAERKLYDGFTGLDFNTPFPWGEGPRRMGADKQGDVVWVCDFFGGNLARIDTHTRQVTLVPLPDAAVQFPYHATIDKSHQVWVNMMNSDQLMRYDPNSGRFTFFDLPTLGAETRYVSLLERDGEMAVVLPEFRPMKVAVMTFRSEQDMAAARERLQGR